MVRYCQWILSRTIFFDTNVNGQVYLNFLLNELPVLMENVDFETRLQIWIQQAGAPPHSSRVVRNFLNEYYAGRWIGRSGPVEWPPRSPDLTSPDLFLWGFIKNIVFEREPTSREDMIQRITDACRRIPRNVLLSTVSHFQRRLQFCINVNGNVFEHLLNS